MISVTLRKVFLGLIFFFLSRDENHYLALRTACSVVLKRFNEVKLEQLRSLRKKTVARLFEVSVTVNNEESADGCLAPLLADSFVVKTISCLVGEGEKERTGSEVGKTDV